MYHSSHISGTGSYLPAKVLANTDLEKLVDTNDNWIVERTGISVRHIADEGEVTSDLAMKAAERALEAANLSAQDIDGIIFATVTPERIMPSAACVLQTKLGCKPGMAFDVSAACSGFLYAMNVADSLIQTGTLKHVLVIGAEALSRIVDYSDRETCILFGDGAGAVVLSRNETPEHKNFLSFRLAANGTLGDNLTLKSPFASGPFEKNEEAVDVKALQPFVQMRGREIFRSAVTALTERCREAMTEANCPVDKIDWFIPHQANIRIIEAVGSQIGINLEKVVVNVSSVGNTSSASIPIAFDEAVRAGKIQRGDRVMMAAFGAGLTSASTLFVY